MVNFMFYTFIIFVYFDRFFNFKLVFNFENFLLESGALDMFPIELNNGIKKSSNFTSEESLEHLVVANLNFKRILGDQTYSLKLDKSALNG